MDEFSRGFIMGWWAALSVALLFAALLLHFAVLQTA